MCLLYKGGQTFYKLPRILEAPLNKEFIAKRINSEIQKSGPQDLGAPESDEKK
jgi:hypothetical protein